MNYKKSLFNIGYVFFVFICVSYVNTLTFAKNVKNKTDLKKQQITLKNFLLEVKNNNGEYRNYEEKMISDKAKISEKNLVTALTAFAEAGWQQDFKQPQIDYVNYDHINNTNYNIGLSQDTDFGLNAKLYYDLSKLGYVASEPFMEDYSVGSFKIGLKQDLLKNSFGEATRAEKSLIENQNMSNFYANEYSLKTILQNAENTYWNLVVLKQTIEVKKKSVKQLDEMYKYTAQKVKMNLMDVSDSMQSKAALETGKLDLQTSIDMEKDISRAFNYFRGINSDVIDATLEDIPWDYLQSYKVEKEYQPTPQLKSIEKQVDYVKANTIIQKDKYKPELAVEATYSFNGQQDSISRSFRNTFKDDLPDRSIGITFTAPLNFSSIKDYNYANYKDENAVKLLYKQQSLVDKANWDQLLDKLSYAQNRLKLSRQIELIQEQKLKEEVKRWRNGVSTTFQVLQFENELTQSRLDSLNIANEIFTIISNLKVFGSSMENTENIKNN